MLEVGGTSSLPAVPETEPPAAPGRFIAYVFCVLHNYPIWRNRLDFKDFVIDQRYMDS